MSAVFLLTACGDTVTVSERPRVSYADIQPAAGMSYQDFRHHEDWGEGDALSVQKRFILLDRDNNGRLSDREIGAR